MKDSGSLWVLFFVGHLIYLMYLSPFFCWSCTLYSKELLILFCGNNSIPKWNISATDFGNSEFKSLIFLNGSILSFSLIKYLWWTGIGDDPKNGKTYDCYMWIVKEGELEIKGVVLVVHFICRTTTWTIAQ